ncbi:MAG: transglycosylase domain-containing protein [Pyrinomonadaceae bacterium]
MAIEITSYPEKHSSFSFQGASRTVRKLAGVLESIIPDQASDTPRILFRCVCVLLAIGLVAGTDSLLHSYKYYSRIIDARIATGYLTSRPGLYAAPRSIQPGQKLPRQALITELRRAGYVASDSSTVWNGSYNETTSAVEIRPQHTNKGQPSVVRVIFDTNDRIAALTANETLVDSFTLEPEVLSNDLSSKAGKRETLTFSEIPPVLVHAILAIEDHRFFQHSGVDLYGIGRALLRNAGDDRIGQGGSTITQQLVKNTYLSPERTFQRKYAEALLAFALERRLSKKDIFALYCNEIYLGQRGAVGIRGVKEAVRVYFGKDIKDISLTEAATIAGMIQGPVRYSPLRHSEATRARRNTVLEAMVRDGWVAREQAAASAKEPVVVSPPATSNDSLAPYFVDYVNRSSELVDSSIASPRVYTTIDLNLQQLAEAALKRQLDRLDVVHKNRIAKPQAALVALDPKTGNVLAMVGGRDYAESQLNRASDARRQPGSTFKPFVYAAALEDGISPVRTFSDAPRDFVYDRNRIYHPANFGGGYSMRDVTMRTGLVKSLNVVTVDIALQTGLARIANLAQQFGLPRPERYPSLALGTKEVTPLELAAAYATFVNGGRRVQPKIIASVGEPPAAHLSNGETAAAQVISPTTAYMITNMLTAVVDHGTARVARGSLKGTAIAGKTGTSRDGWFVGFTPNLVCAVWIGYDDNQQLGLTGADAALPAWIDFMKAAVELKPELGGRTFECPEGIEFVEIDAQTGSLSTLECPYREVIAVTERLAPNVECFLHSHLPESIGIQTDDVADSESPKQPVHTQHAKSSGPPLSESGSSRSAATRIDVDASGHRTLVNMMR